MENLIGDPEVNSGQNAGAKSTMLVEQWESSNFFGVDFFYTILLALRAFSFLLFLERFLNMNQFT